MGAFMAGGQRKPQLNNPPSTGDVTPGLEIGHFANPFGLPLSETLSETLSSFLLNAAARMLTHHKLNVYEKALALGAEELLNRIVSMLNRF
jgi:hypothetical protein